jgi:hypothetical protein
MVREPAHPSAFGQVPRRISCADAFYSSLLGLANRRNEFRITENFVKLMWVGLERLPPVRETVTLRLG